MRTRFVIKAANGAYFTEFESSKTVDVKLKGVVIGHDQFYQPKFEAFSTKQAAKFDTEADARAQVKNEGEFHGGPDAFAGCTVHSTED